ncbi:1430_t:CDS:2 [Paraglomus occultum]|uniref:1430_t:CDS:1 n=1 Tax=Paraglomus occultum TaxID=144539 RepID=A0A9N8YZL1_9GLOM|nr:1430_t:CDS:2 [Paraglomus occultum]
MRRKRVLEESKKTLEDEQTQKDQLLGLIYTLDAFGLKFDEYIGEIAEENSPSVLNKLGEKWTEYLRQQEISNEEMPAGKRKKDLLAAIEKRKSAIEKGELAKTKTEAEKIAEARNEADGLKKRIRNFQEELKRRNITSEENN